jgi:hypothetical protein
MANGDRPLDQRIYAGTYLRDPDSPRITGIRFQVWLTCGETTVSIQEPPSLFDLSQTDNLQAALGELAAILAEAAQKPERILRHLRQFG